MKTHVIQSNQSRKQSREVATFADGIKLCRAVKEKTFCNEERCCDME